MRFLREKVTIAIFLFFILSIGFYAGNAQAYYGGYGNLGSITTPSGTTFLNTPTNNNFAGLGGGLSGISGLYGGLSNLSGLYGGLSGFGGLSGGLSGLGNLYGGLSGLGGLYGGLSGGLSGLGGLSGGLSGLGGLYGGLSGLGGLYGGVAGLGGSYGSLNNAYNQLYGASGSTYVYGYDNLSGLGGLYGGLAGGLSGLGGLYGGLSGFGGLYGGLSGLGGLYGGLSGLGGLYGMGGLYGGLYGLSGIGNSYGGLYGASGLGSLYGLGLASPRLGFGDSLSLIRQPQVLLPGTTTSLPAVGGGGGLPDPTGAWSGTWLSYINLKGGIANFNLIYDPLTLTVSGTAALLLNKLIPIPISVSGVNTAAGVVLSGSFFDPTKLVTYYADFTCVLVSPLFITGDYTIHDALFLESDIGEFNLNLVI